MNETSISSAPSTGTESAPSTAKPSVKVAAKSAKTSAPASKKPVKAPSKTAAKTTTKTAKPKPAKPVTATPPVSPVKAKTSPAKAPQAKAPQANATQAKASDKKKTAAPAKVAKEKKVKVVRDSFTLPKTELLQITEMKKRAMALGVEVKKSELIRAGLQALAGMADTAFKKAISNVPTIKTGRQPKTEGAPKQADQIRSGQVTANSTVCA